MNVIMINVFLMNVILMNIILLNVILMNVILMNVILMNVILMNVILMNIILLYGTQLSTYCANVILLKSLPKCHYIECHSDECRSLNVILLKVVAPFYGIISTSLDCIRKMVLHTRHSKKFLRSSCDHFKNILL